MNGLSVHFHFIFGIICEYTYSLKSATEHPIVRGYVVRGIVRQAIYDKRFQSRLVERIACPSGGAFVIHVPIKRETATEEHCRLHSFIAHRIIQSTVCCHLDLYTLEVKAKIFNKYIGAIIARAKVYWT